MAAGTFVTVDLLPGGERHSLLWIIFAFIFLTIGEILISPVGLELAFVAAPKSMKSFVTACFLLTSSIASYANGLITPVYSLEVIPTQARAELQALGFQASNLAMAPGSIGLSFSTLEESVISAKFAAMKRFTPTQYFGTQVLMALAAMVALYFVAKPFNKRLAEQQAVEAKG
jgi:dipeptide/tripeptide permease